VCWFPTSLTNLPRYRLLLLLPQTSTSRSRLEDSFYQVLSILPTSQPESDLFPHPTSVSWTLRNDTPLKHISSPNTLVGNSPPPPPPPHNNPPKMSTDGFKTKTMKRKNIRGLALNAPPKSVTPSAPDAQIPGGLGNGGSEQADTLEIGVEFRLDLRSDDLIVLKELGAGNGGTVSKVQHAATKVIMARKVYIFF
jgi:hypothetical protein